MTNTGNRRPPNAGKGRPKGSVNKTTASTKAALTDAFEKLGGVASLVAWGRKNRSEFYKLWGKLVPQEVTGSDGGPVTVKVVYSHE